jgi:GR25 family glycosyltransferase involved in LPS biosynthesis
MTRAIPDRLAGGIDAAFPHKVCINLDRRPERWRRMRLKLARQGIHSVERFAALDGDALSIPAHWTHTPGAYGCLRSHVEVVGEARRLGLRSLLIFEDDVVFAPRLREKFESYFKQLPPDWDMLFFGALHKDEPVKVSENVARLTRSNSTYAYALRDTIFDAFVELNSKAADVLDNNSFVLQQRFNCYCFMPHLAWVETDYSDAQQRLERHWYLKESLVLFGAGADRLLGDTTIVLAHGGDGGDARATENLLYLASYYHFFFSPHVAVVVVEQGARPTVDSASLPPGCEYVFLRDEGRFDRARCFKAGIENSDAARKYVVLSDGDIYLETLDFRANLIMCDRRGCATGFSEVFDLTAEETRRLRETNVTRGIDITNSATRTADARDGYCRFFRRDAIQSLEGLGDGLGGVGAEQFGMLSTSEGRRRLRAFQSPNHALRLSRG